MYNKFITTEGNCCIDKNEIVNEFNKYFTNIGQNLNAKLNQTVHDPTHYINNNPANFFCTPTCPTEIINIVHSNNSKKSGGYDNVDPNIIQHVIPQIANQLAHIFNNSFTMGIVPRKLKIAKVIPLYKSENPELFTNYRPISILPCLSKILERLMYNRINNFLAEYNILSNKQYGFRGNYSTYMAMIDLVDKISSNIDQKNHNIGIFLDLSKAFDTIDHNILLKKLQCYGIRGIACEWFKSYLSDRAQYVLYNNTESEYMKITCGVPQGSILGPLLFIIYINDIVNVSNILKPMLFADDTSLFHAHTHFHTLIEEVNIELQKIAIWFNTNKLTLNVKKSNFIIFTPKGKIYNTDNAEIIINGNKIKQVKFTKFLGIYIDEHLSWKIHINNLAKKIARNVGMLNKLKYFLPLYTMKTLYYSLTLPHLQYCVLLWSNTYTIHLKKIKILQKRAIRIITKSQYTSHTDPLFLKLKLLKLSDIYKHQLGIFMYKSVNDQLPDNLTSMLKLTENIHNHNLRNFNGFYIQNIRTNNRKFTINYSGPVFWNTLPQHIRKLRTIKQFKGKLKELLLMGYVS